MIKKDKLYNILYKMMLVLIIIIALILGGIRSDSATEIEQKAENSEKASVEYRTHVQGIGWQDYKADGELAGTEGRSLRLEGINIKLNENSNLDIEYQTHIQNVGWQDWKKNGEMAGTEGRKLRLEAIKIKLSEQDDYSVMYRVHIQSLGWQDWKYDGELAGTEGQSLRLEAIEIKIIPKQKKGLLHLDTATNGTKYYTEKNLKVSGWKMANISNTKIEAYIDDIQIDENEINYIARNDVLESITGYGTKEQNGKPGFEFNVDLSKLTEGNHDIKIYLLDKNGERIQGYLTTISIDRDPHIIYDTYLQNREWQGEKVDGEMAGTVGEDRRVEAIKIDGVNLPDDIKITYQAHIQNIGWQEWKNEGEMAGTTNQSKRIEAIRIKLENTTEYSIEYRVHVQGIGWQDWCYDGETAGTVDESKRVEAIEIKLVPKINNIKTRLYMDKPNTQIDNVSGKVSGWLMTTVPNTRLRISIDNQYLDETKITRTDRQDVLNSIKGYGDESINNSKPGFEIDVDFSTYSLGTHRVLVECLNESNQVISTFDKTFTIRKKIEYGEGTYGITGLKAANSPAGTDLKYYKYGSGPNVFFATFTIHGFEDLWNNDGLELIQIANDFYQRLISNQDYELAEKWTIYILPGVNMDGVVYGTTNDGPGRTTLFSQAPNNKGIDLNRCWQVGSSYKRYTDSRNYNGTTGFQAYEAQYLRDFLLSHKSVGGQTILVDLHGWTQQLIGDAGICSYYQKQFPENSTKTIGQYGDGYLINWARNSLGSNGIPARSALIELPKSGVKNHQSVEEKQFRERYINATLEMLKNIV